MVRKVAFTIVAVICIAFLLAGGMLHGERRDGVAQQLAPSAKGTTVVLHDLHGNGHPTP